MTDLYVYQSGDGQWIVFNNGIKTFFTDESEAISMATKLTFASKAQSLATILAQASNDLDDLVTVYFDEGFDSGGADPIANGDIESLGITAVELGSMITFAQQFNDFLNNAAVATLDRDPTLNAMRTDV
jgi:hypothetical protein